MWVWSWLADRGVCLSSPLQKDLFGEIYSKQNNLWGTSFHNLMGHIITLILDLLTHWTVSLWFSWHDCTQEKNVECVNGLHLSYLNVGLSIRRAICTSVHKLYSSGHPITSSIVNSEGQLKCSRLHSSCAQYSSVCQDGEGEVVWS